MKQSPDVSLVHMTPTMAQTQQEALASAQKLAVQNTVDELNQPAQAYSPALGPGTKLSVTLWNYQPRLEITGPAPTQLGTFVVGADGSISLSYLNKVALSGLSLQEAQQSLSSRYAALGLFQRPSILIDVSASPKGQVMVTGAIGQPHVLNWPPEGLTLSRALTESLGDGAAILSQESGAAGRNMIASVVIRRGNIAYADLPIYTALEQDIALRPGDRIVVRKTSAVEVTVLGPGIQNSGVFGFGHVPSLSEVLARGAGLNGNTANDRAVFVLRESSGEEPVLYDFSWDKAQGVVASHRFPVLQGDLVYVAEAPIVPIQRVINLLFQVAVPAQLAK